MNKTAFLLGVALGFAGTLLGSFLFIKFFTTFDFNNGIQTMKLQNTLGKLITLGSIPNLLIFAVLLKLNKEMMARGVLLSIIILAFVTMFV
jgi:mannose/fructose/N-acetylgalactosamine-specific phosphotransferase system component IID